VIASNITEPTLCCLSRSWEEWKSKLATRIKKARNAGTHARQCTVLGQRSYYSDSVTQEQPVRGFTADQEMVKPKAEKRLPRPGSKVQLYSNETWSMVDEIMLGEKVKEMPRSRCYRD